MVMFDLDHFKDINDKYGHLAGDAVLAGVGALMKAVLRGSDVKCRYGGEEFLIVMPEASLEAARGRAEALRVAMRQLNISHEGQALGQVTISLGLAMVPQHGTRVAELIAAADEALYAAKNGGRDRLVVRGE